MQFDQKKMKLSFNNDNRIALFLDFDQTVSCFDILSKIPDLQKDQSSKSKWKELVDTEYNVIFTKNLEYAKNLLKNQNSSWRHPKQKINEFLSHLFPAENIGIEITEKSKVLQGFSPQQLFDFGKLVKRQSHVDAALNTFFGNFESTKEKADLIMERDLVICSYNWSRHIVCFSFFIFLILVKIFPICFRFWVVFQKFSHNQFPKF